MLDVQTVIAAAVPIILGLAWLLRLEGRVNTGEKLHNALRDDVSYIRERIDMALNGRDH